MTLLYPLGLLGFLTLPVIIGLHLHMERNRKTVVSSMYLWAFLDQKFQGSKPRFLKISWLLVLDLLIASLLSLAFAQPQIKLPSIRGEDTQFFVLMDTSTSMLSTDIAPSRFSAAKQEAISILDSLEGNQTAVVIAVGTHAEVIGDSSTQSIDFIKQRIEGLAAGDTKFDLRLGLGLIENLVDDQRPVGVHIVTDGANSPDLVEDFPYQVQWHFFGESGNNQAITNLALREITPGEYQLYADLVNFSLSERTRQVRVLVDGLEVNRREVNLLPESSSPLILSLFGNIDFVRVEFLESDLLAEDDFAGAGWVGVDAVSVALVTDDPAPLDRAISAVSNTVLEIISPDLYSYSSDYDVTIFRDYLPEDWPSGLTMVFDPPPENELLPVVGVQIIENDMVYLPDPLIQGIDFTGVRWESTRLLPGWQDQYAPIISFGDEVPILLKGEHQRGRLFIFLPSLGPGNLTMHPAFPLLVANLVEQARGFLPQQNYPIGTQLHFSTDDAVELGTVTSPAGIEFDVSSGQTISLDQFGRYLFTQRNYSGASTVISFGVNGGDRDEGLIRPQDWIEEYARGEIDTRSFPKIVIDLAPWLLALVVLLLLVEAWRAWR